MSAAQIITSWKKKSFKPVYWLDGDEPFFIDQVVNYAEHHLLSETEAGFNLTVFYGKDADWAAIINACRRYPMFAERQVVLLKEAQQMRDTDLNHLEGYVEKPMPTTIFIVSYKGKKVDARTRLAKMLKKNAEILTTKKLYDSELPDWVTNLVADKGLSIRPKALRLLVDSIGNDLSRISNEVNKLAVNLAGRKEIAEDDIETYIGISKDFNVFELQTAIGNRDMARSLRIIQYFASNPKAGPIQMVLPALYNFFSKTAMVFSLKTRDKKAVASLGINPYFANDYMVAAQNYQYSGIEKILLLLHEYNLRSIGIHDTGTESASLLKEMVVKIME